MEITHIGTQQLWDQVVEIWNDLAQDEYCLTLVNSMP